jgi:hypothetical protein
MGLKAVGKCEVSLLEAAETKDKAKDHYPDKAARSRNCVGRPVKSIMAPLFSILSS